MGAVDDGAVDFFVSYTSADRPWAEWIAWELEQAAHSTVIQAWDIQPGSNFVVAMHEATQVAERTIAVLSPAFLESEFCQAEWGAAFREDPTGRERRLLPVRVRACDPHGLPGSIVYVDLVGLEPVAAREALLAAVSAERAKPVRAPAHPGGAAGKQPRHPVAGAAVFNVPVTTRTFVGREGAMEQLANGLSGEGVVAITQVQAIHGLGGVGKTQLAARYARTRRQSYDVIWWLRAEQPATLRADLANLASALGLAGIEVDEQEAITAARSWLERNRRWLLVFDNATAPVFIAEHVPEGEGGHVLITSRAHADWRALNAQPLALDVWKREESRKFLGARTGENDADALDKVAEALGDLPLALEQAAAYANRQAIGLPSYLQRLQNRSPELLAVGQPHGYEHTVATVWTMAFEQIHEHPVAQELLGLCACLAPERIPRELLDAYGQTAGTDIVDERMVGAAIELLLDYALLSAAADRTLGMHRLVGQLTRENATAIQRRRAAGNAVTLLDQVLPERPWEHEQWPACQRLLAHALAASEHASLRGAAPEHTARLLVGIAQYQRSAPST